MSYVMSYGFNISKDATNLENNIQYLIAQEPHTHPVSNLVELKHKSALDRNSQEVRQSIPNRRFSRVFIPPPKPQKRPKNKNKLSGPLNY